jgi:hypothetical protein
LNRGIKNRNAMGGGEGGMLWKVKMVKGGDRERESCKQMMRSMC